jgi:chromosome segregation protein
LIATNEELVGNLEIERNRLIKYESDLEVRKVQVQGLNEELTRIDSELEHDNSLLEQLTGEYEVSQEKMISTGVTRVSYLAQKDEAQKTMDVEREAWSKAKEEAHALELTYESLKQASAASLKDVKQNFDIQDGLKSRLTSLNKELSLLIEPRQLEKANLEIALEEKLKSEQGLAEARKLLEGYNEELSSLNNEYAEKNSAVSELKSQLESVRLEERTFQVKLSELMNRFEQTEEVFEQTLEALQQRHEESTLSETLEKLRNKISKLEPINLAAIDEFEELSKRKVYLDDQDADLTEALDTLKGAIRKIDGETKARFKETYDSVDAKLQKMFPVLFGGGKAHLEMTEDDLLNTGVTVMARPPGKRNSSIQLLSGGEKALTALAFVFSIFELNPAPFCLLDEVDAPLDDANVVRLTELLKSMSETVQFLFVTHNKITMEIAEQLIGVTMQEAGVSRLVSVNIDKAVELAATA